MAYRPKGQTMNSTRLDETQRALISGAGFAGLAAAFWMRKLGYRVTVVETGSTVKNGGTPVDIRGDTIAVVERMGILDAIRNSCLPARPIEFINTDGGTDARIEPGPVDSSAEGDGFEVPRDDLLAILLDALDGGVEVLFENSISTLTDVPGGIRAEFRDGSEGEFAIVLGCDGNHSTVRKLRFGSESKYTHFLHNYFAVAIVDEILIDHNTTRILSTPGRTLMLNSYQSRTDISFSFYSAEEIRYDYHDQDQQKSIVRAQFSDAGAPFAEVVEKSASADNFYLDKLSQTKMPHWTAGRVALVGDAGYCASPAAGMGGSLAILGAAALFDALQAVDGDLTTGFANYERNFRPVVEQIQAAAVEFGLATYFPQTDDDIRARNAHFAG
jgi:2-polyprenyl-6-methoxyphenol hydroxylase-like FAD-dependent oxidoreductase